MYTVVRFHTSFYETSEGAVVNISNVVCQGEVDAIVVQASPFDYCDTDQYVSVSGCYSFSGDTEITTSDLYIDTDYLIIASDTITDPFGTSMTVEVNGAPFTMEGCALQVSTF